MIPLLKNLDTVFEVATAASEDAHKFEQAKAAATKIINQFWEDSVDVSVGCLALVIALSATGETIDAVRRKKVT